MGNDLQPTFFKFTFRNTNCRILIQITSKFVAKDQVNNKPPLAQMIAWFANAYMHHSVRME